MQEFWRRLFASRTHRPQRIKGKRAFRPCLETLEDRQLLSTYTVINTNDSGQGSLRWAIEKTNSNPGTDTINFSIGSGGPQTISPLSALPDVTERVVIDATTQPGFVGRPIIELNGALAGGGGGPGLGVDGLRITADGCLVRGLVINRFTGDGIELLRADGNLLVGNYLGTDLTGRLDQGNGGNGVFVYGGHGATIGGTTAVARNVISGNTGAGVFILGDATGATGNTVLGNYIGTTAAGSAALGNSSDGVLLRGAGNTVGGTVAGAGNVISGNQGSGVHLVTTLSMFRDAATGNRVQGNYIGTNAAGTAALGNASGVSLFSSSNNTIGGTTAAARNVISGNQFSGVAISADLIAATGNRVQGNYIGTNAAGTAALGNTTGVSLFQASTNNTIGGTVAGARNVISGNSSHGIHIGWDFPLVSGVPTGNLVQGNHVGTDVTGTFALPNSTGVFINGGSNNTIGGSAAARNLISGNHNSGVRILGTGAAGNFVQSNLIGTNAAGTAALGNGTGVSIQDSDNNTVGGKLGTEGNLISGNGGDGVNILGSDATGNRVLGNYVGTNAAGTAALGNSAGVLVNGAANNDIGGIGGGDRNVISGNRSSGVVLMATTATGNRVQGNFIGTRADGINALANGSHGVHVTALASNNSIGGRPANAGNTIAFNGGDGVFVESGSGNAILSNSIHSNAGLGIDLGPNGVTPNDPLDADLGANGLQNAPVLDRAASDVGFISGKLHSRPNATYTVQFFASPSADPSGFGEGKIFLGSLTVMTDGNGNATFSFSPSFFPAFATGDWISATATDSANNTSEFSNSVRAGPII